MKIYLLPILLLFLMSCSPSNERVHENEINTMEINSNKSVFKYEVNLIQGPKLELAFDLISDTMTYSYQNGQILGKEKLSESSIKKIDSLYSFYDQLSLKDSSISGYEGEWHTFTLITNNGEKKCSTWSSELKVYNHSTWDLLYAIFESSIKNDGLKYKTKEFFERK